MRHTPRLQSRPLPMSRRCMPSTKSAKRTPVPLFCPFHSPTYPSDSGNGESSLIKFRNLESAQPAASAAFNLIKRSVKAWSWHGLGKMENPLSSIQKSESGFPLIDARERATGKYTNSLYLQPTPLSTASRASVAHNRGNSNTTQTRHTPRGLNVS